MANAPRSHLGVLPDRSNEAGLLDVADIEKRKCPEHDTLSLGAVNSVSPFEADLLTNVLNCL